MAAIRIIQIVFFIVIGNILITAVDALNSLSSAV